MTVCLVLKFMVRPHHGDSDVYEHFFSEARPSDVVNDSTPH